jgi:hypothetical protein
VPRIPAPAAGPSGTAAPRPPIVDRLARVRAAAWRRRRLALPILAGVLAIGLVAGAFALLWTGEGTKLVQVYVTDLPGGLDAVEFDLAAVTVGSSEVPLRVEQSRVEISGLQGPEAALRVADGRVPKSLDGSVTLVFSGARGLRGGVWFDLDFEQRRLVLPQGLPPGRHASQAALFDFNLEASLVERDGKIGFQPHVQSVYHYSHQHEASLVDLTPVLDALKKLDNPLQHLYSISDDDIDRIVKRICERLRCDATESNEVRYPTSAPTSCVPTCFPLTTTATTTAPAGAPNVPDVTGTVTTGTTGTTSSGVTQTTATTQSTTTSTSQSTATSTSPTTSSPTSTTSPPPENQEDCLGSLCPR